MGLLSEDDIGTELASLPAWTRAGDSITSEVTLADFRAALLYVGAVAYLAEQANHHPDVLIQWNKVTLTLSTHSAGGLTGADFALARQISALPDGHGGPGGPDRRARYLRPGRRHAPGKRRPEDEGPPRLSRPSAPFPCRRPPPAGGAAGRARRGGDPPPLTRGPPVSQGSSSYTLCVLVITVRYQIEADSRV